ncbi:IS3 family transposase [Thalassomonas actiniarum]|uniref:IS3 family transposase n=1 Tax=Thalassomonas actiniarum TaxID=485447 RepID=A0AAE9YSC6_9GAMM|nr:IS3 family transposase [Thalassomonas actiniarum]WDE00341.1 IS3 family transposase [Thalassomonas actiniarum]
MTKKQTQAYTEEFRKEAVLRSEQPGNSAASVGKELGVSAQQIYNWRCQFNRLSDKQFNSLNGVDYSKKEVRKYALIAEFWPYFTVVLMCRALQVSGSGFYRWLSCSESRWKSKHQEVTANIIDVYATFKARYGAPRITQELRALGLKCSKNYVADLMNIEGLRARNGKAFKYSRHSPVMFNVADNLLNRLFNVEKPNQKWVTDITYIWVKDQWLYLATVMDLFLCCIVGWLFAGCQHDRTTQYRCLENGLKQARYRPRVDCSLRSWCAQYRAVKYQDLIKSQGGLVSMSRRGNCWDNAVMESFYSRLKVELIYAEQYRSIEEAKSGIFE